MAENEEYESEAQSAGWLYHSLIAVAMVIVLVVLLVLQPWSGRAGSVITSVDSCRLAVVALIMDGTGIFESSQEMSYIAPDRFRTVTTAGNERHEMIVIGDDLYASDESQVSGSYTVTVISRNLVAMIPGKEHTQSILGQLSGVEELLVERIDGIPCRHYQGRIDFEKNIEEQIASLDPDEPGYERMLEFLESQIESMKRIETNIHVWVGIDDGFIRQSNYAVQIPDEYEDGPYSSNTFLRYYDFNMPVVIEAPLDSSGKLLPGWYRAPTSE